MFFTKSENLTYKIEKGTVKPFIIDMPKQKNAILCSEPIDNCPIVHYI